MKEIIINDNQEKEEAMEMKVIRVKGFIFNSKGQILLAHNNNTYQFPGGHKKENESLDECIIREIKEETGILLEVLEKPFLCIKTYDSNYFGTGKKVLNCIYYYRFFTDEVPDFTETHYDELELCTEFKLFYLNFNSLEDFLKKNQFSKDMDPNIAREMLYAVEEYHSQFDKEQ